MFFLKSRKSIQNKFDFFIKFLGEFLEVDHGMPRENSQLATNLRCQVFQFFCSLVIPQFCILNNTFAAAQELICGLVREPNVVLDTIEDSKELLRSTALHSI